MTFLPGRELLRHGLLEDLLIHLTAGRAAGSGGAGSVPFRQIGIPPACGV
jgi:hypothetical protein